MFKNDGYVNIYLTKPYKPKIPTHSESQWNSTPECEGKLFLYNLLSINYYQVYIRCVFPPDIFSKSIKSKNQVYVFQLRLNNICGRTFEMQDQNVNKHGSYREIQTQHNH